VAVHERDRAARQLAHLLDHYQPTRYDAVRA
jgi:hypothetical protein